MKKIVFLLIASLSLAFMACNKEKINKVNPDDITVNLNKAELQERIEIMNYPVTLNTFKVSGPIQTPVPELWAIARILPGKRTYSVFHWYDPNSSVVRTTATNVAPLYTPPATPGNPSNTTPFYLSADNSFGGPGTFFANEELIAGQTLSMTAAGLRYDGAATPPWASSNYAYFTSHVRGDVYGGEIFVVHYLDINSVDNDAAIQAEASIFDNTADYNDLTIDHTDGPGNVKLWIAGDNNARGAIIRNVKLFDLESLFFPSTVIGPEAQQKGIVGLLNEYHMPILGPSGNSVTIPQDDPITTSTDESQQLWVVAGGTSYGGLVVMDKDDDTRLYTRTDAPMAKHFDMCETPNTSGSYGAFLYGNGFNDGDGSKLRIFNTSIGPYRYKEFDIDAEVTFEGKNAIDVDETKDLNPLTQDGFFVYMAMGKDGILKVAAQNPGEGTVVDSYNLNYGPNFGDDSTYGGNGLANGLVVHGNYVYVAWGASGLLIFDKNDLAQGPIGQYNGIGSCNYVAVDTRPPSNDDILFAGFGTGGIVMLKFANVVGQ